MQQQKQKEVQVQIHLLKMKIYSLSLSRDQNEIKNSLEIENKSQRIFKQEFKGSIQTKIFSQKGQLHLNDATKVFNDKINFDLNKGKSMEIENKSVIIQSTGKDILSIEVFINLDHQQKQQNNLHFLLKFQLKQFYAIPFVSHNIQAKFKLLNKEKINQQYKNLILNGQFELQYVLEQWGRLRISKITAQNMTNTQMFGKIDPYLIITNGVNSQTIRSKVKQNSGQNATWDEDFFLNVRHKTKIIKIQVFDKDQIYDDKIGQADIDLLDSGMLLQTIKSSLKKQIFLKTSEKKDAGILTIEFKFQPSRPIYTFKFQKQEGSEWHEEQQANNTFSLLFDLQKNPFANLIRSAGNKISQTL